MKGLKNLLPDDRPREKLEQFGTYVLSDAELLALIMQQGRRGQNVLDLARQLLTSFGDITKLATLNHRELCSLEGIGRAKALALVATFELSRRHATRLQPDPIHVCDPNIIHQKFGPKLSHLKHEEFYLLILNSANRLTRYVQISKGILNASLVHPREVFRTAILESAASVILLHNHPSGEVQPSFEDESITKRLVEAGELLNIPVLDHVIVGGRGIRPVNYTLRHWREAAYL